MKHIIFCILALLASLAFVACEEEWVVGPDVQHSFAIKLCDENGTDILNESMDKNICDTRITIVCEGESINVSNPRHPEWDPMWPALDGSNPVMKSRMEAVDPEYYSNPSLRWNNILCAARDDIKDSSLTFEFIVGPKRIPVKIIRASVAYVNGEIVAESKIPTYLYIDIVLSDKDLCDIHDWTARQQGK